MEAGDYDTACSRFRESDRLDPAVGTKFNLANCEEQRGRVATAWELFRAVAETLPETDERRPIALERAETLHARLPRLTLRLAEGAPPETRAVRGGVELGVGAFGLPLPVDPGTIDIEVRAPGHENRRYTTELAEAAEMELVVEPGAPISTSAPAAPAPGPEPAPAQSPQPLREATADSGDDHRTLGYVLGGVGLVGVGVGAVAGIMALGEKDTADQHCSDELRLCDQTGKGANDRGRTLGAVSSAGFVVGGLGLAAGAYFGATASSPAIDIRVGTRGASVVWEGSW
jgi:hypothetical protein